MPHYNCSTCRHKPTPTIFPFFAKKQNVKYHGGKNVEATSMDKQPFSFFNLMRTFNGKHVIVEVEDCKIHGKLVYYQLAQNTTHVPFILVLESPVGKVLVRGNWFSIGVVGDKK